MGEYYFVESVAMDLPTDSKKKQHFITMLLNVDHARNKNEFHTTTYIAVNNEILDSIVNCHTVSG